MSSYRKISDFGNVKDPVQHYKVLEIQNAQHKHDIIRNNTIVCVNVHANWCKPCKLIAPQYASLAKNYAGSCSLVEENLELKLSQNIETVPTFLFHFRGQFYNAISGADLEKVEKILQELIQETEKVPVVAQTTTTTTGYPTGGNEVLYRQNYGQDPHPQTYPSFNNQ